MPEAAPNPTPAAPSAHAAPAAASAPSSPAPAAPATFETEPGAALFGVSPRKADPDRDRPSAPSALPTADSVAAKMAADKGAPAGEGAEASEPPIEAAPAEGAKPKYAFAGYEAEADTVEAAQAAVEHKIKTMRGSFKSAVEKRQAAEANYETAVQRASAWEQAARRLGYRDDGTAEPQPANPAPAATAPKTPTPSAAAPQEIPEIDWTTYQEILKDPEGGPGAAAFFLAQEQDRVVEAKVEKALEARDAKLRGEFEPVLSTHQQSAHFSAMDARIVALQSYVDPRTGVEAYPELKDTKALVGIGQILTQMGVKPEEVAKASDLTWHQAVLQYRWNSTGTITPAPSTPSAAPALPSAPAPIEDDSAAAAALAGVHAPAVRPAPHGAFAPTGQVRDRVFGVAPR